MTFNFGLADDATSSAREPAATHVDTAPNAGKTRPCWRALRVAPPEVAAFVVVGALAPVES
jgi:hypothetical protein